MSDSETARPMFCASCGKPTPVDAPFCRYCGAQVTVAKQTTEKMVCPSCGHPRTSDAVFCEKCSLGFTTVQQPSAATIPPTMSRGKQLMIGIVSLFVLLAAMGGLFLANTGWKFPGAGTTAADNVASGSTQPSTPAAPTIATDDKYVAAVRNGVLAAPYNTTTVGKAFEVSFTDCKWRSGETEKGQRVVAFTGRLKPPAYKKRFDLQKICIDDAEKPNDARGLVDCSELLGGQEGWTGTVEFRHAHTDAEIELAASTVTFQFHFSATDASSFRVGYIDLHPWENVFGWGNVFGPGTSPQATILDYIYQ